MNSLCSSYAIQHAVKVVEVSSWLCVALGALTVLWAIGHCRGARR